MAAIIFFHNDNKTLSEIKKVIKPFNILSLCVLNEFNRHNIQKLILEEEAHIIICSEHMDNKALTSLKTLHDNYPFTTLIYFNSNIKSGDFSRFNKAGIDHFLTGKSRYINLNLILKKILHNNWKKVPDSLLNTASKKSGKRLNTIIEFIETQPVKNINIESISQHLHISPSHLRKEFKRIFNTNFRTFKQNLLHYYEDILLLEKKYLPGHIYRILSYNNLSAFSRSFKKRHGSSWRTVIKS